MVLVTSGKKKGNVRRETSAVSAMRVTIMHKKQKTNAPTPSEPSMTRGRSVSMKGSIKGKNNPGIFLRQTCRYYLKGTCTRTPCEHWHPPECRFYKNESGCKAGDQCLFPHHEVDNNQTKSQRKATIPTKEEKATTIMQWLL